MNIYIALFAIVAPFFVWPIEFFLPYPFVIEELAKLFIVRQADIGKSFQSKIVLALVVGGLFAFSESVLYLFNIAYVGNLNTFFTRLTLTVPFHALTSLLFVFSAKRNLLVAGAGLSGAIILHALYNLWIAGYIFS